MQLAYADPPYLGCCKVYGHEHNDGGPMPWDGRCWDDAQTHATLIRHLDREYGGWAYSCTSTSLAALLPHAPEARIGSWVKPFAAFKRNVRIAYTWEPVLFVPGRDRSKQGAPVGRDHIAEPITRRKDFVGTKPVRFCDWILTLLGWVDGDEVHDLFPGLDPMADALAFRTGEGPDKRCTVCGLTKPRSEFYDDRRTWDGKRTKCRTCFSTQVQTRKRARLAA